ncbi:MAG: ABC transporter ATP-binding protein [Chloroflexota bacterium]
MRGHALDEARRDSAEPAGGPPAIAAVGLHHRYATRSGTVVALDPLDVEVRAGELVAILGPSGCGKSTLLRALAGLLQPTSGRAELLGGPPSAQHARQGIGWLAQDDGLLPWLTVAANVGLPFRLAGRRGADEERQAATAVAEMLARVGLVDSAARFPHELSGGMRQRAALARALVARPPFLFLDEPFAHLDELTRERLGDLLVELRHAYRPTTVLVTHSVSEATRLADRALVFSARPGRLLADVAIPLEHPRREDHPEYGVRLHRLKLVLVEGSDPAPGGPG